MNQAEAIALLAGDRVLCIETLMRIENKSRELVPYILNPIQRDMAVTSTGRDIYVKPAQVGASSYFIVDFLLDCLFIEGTVSIIISYNEFITQRLLRKAHVFYNILKEMIPTIDKMVHQSTYEKTFEKMHSSFYICSAGSAAYGRGEIIHNLLLDEYAFWPPGTTERLFTSAIQRVPLTEDTKIRFCSTPNGEDNDFYEVYMGAKEGKDYGKSIYKHHFYPWYMHPEYSMKYDSIFALPRDTIIVLTDFDSEEQILLLIFEQMGVSEEEAHGKLRWRRYKHVEMGSARRSGETRLLFSQEYPENDVDCFLQAGDMVYDVDQVNEMARQCYPAPIHHLFADIWYPPEEGVKYLIAIDPGEGIISESVATVWRFDGDDSTHCATLSGLYKNPGMADKVKDLGRYYNTALLAPEDALDFVPYITDYPELYYMTSPIDGGVGKNIGWKTTKATKPYMVTELMRNLSRIETHDIRFVAQLRNIRWIMGRDGKDRAISMGADDYHDSGAIAIVCRGALPVERGMVGTYGWSDSWGR